MEIKTAVTINKPAEELYGYWRKLDRLPAFMKNIASVRVIDGRRSHWSSKGAAEEKVEWEVEITDDSVNRRIAWRSIEGSEVKQAGAVDFRRGPDERGTEVHVTMEYDPPGGSLGAAAAKLVGKDPATEFRQNLLRFKALMETGEIPTIEGQPKGPA